VSEKIYLERVAEVDAELEDYRDPFEGLKLVFVATISRLSIGLVLTAISAVAVQWNHVLGMIFFTAGIVCGLTSIQSMAWMTHWWDVLDEMAETVQERVARDRREQFEAMRQ
jgi:hypothetical protein